MIYLSDSDDGAAGNGGQHGDQRDAIDLVSSEDEAEQDLNDIDE